MKYQITRTSDWDGEEQPCKKAILEQDCWVIEINSIDELQQLISEVGEIIVTHNSIEIYDTYRE